MKRLSIGGFTAAGVLVLALGAGAVGGMVGAAASDGEAPAQQPVTVDHVAEEATPSPAPTPTEAPAEPVLSEADATVPTMPKPETAAEAADRAKAEADRAKQEADRAEKVAATTAPAPAPAPTDTSVPLDPGVFTVSEEEQAAKDRVKHSWTHAPAPTAPAASAEDSEMAAR